jgi:hypothetical protein
MNLSRYGSCPPASAVCETLLPSLILYKTHGDASGGRNMNLPAIDRHAGVDAKRRKSLNAHSDMSPCGMASNSEVRGISAEWTTP